MPPIRFIVRLDKLFSIPEEKLSDVDFRWIHFDNKYMRNDIGKAIDEA